MNTTHKYPRIACLVGALVALGGFTAGFAFDLDGRHTWSTCGSTGSPDEGALQKINTRGTLVIFSGAEPGIAHIRYPILATDALVGDPLDGRFRFNVAYRDHGANDRVQAFVLQVPLGNPQAATAVASFDSNVYDADARMALRSAGQDSSLRFDFESNVYYLLVILTKYGESHGAAFAGATLAPAQPAS